MFGCHIEKPKVFCSDLLKKKSLFSYYSVGFSLQLLIKAEGRKENKPSADFFHFILSASSQTENPFIYSHLFLINMNWSLIWYLDVCTCSATNKCNLSLVCCRFWSLPFHLVTDLQRAVFVSFVQKQASLTRGRVADDSWCKDTKHITVMCCSMRDHSETS